MHKQRSANHVFVAGGIPNVATDRIFILANGGMPNAAQNEEESNYQSAFQASIGSIQFHSDFENCPVKDLF
jgi:hypothetical protein